MASENMDRISGNGRISVLEQVKRERITLQMILVGREYERLTMISAIKTEKGRTFLAVDCPSMFSEDAVDHEGAKVRIEFVGKDRIQYFFDTRVVKVSGPDLWLELPEYIDRIQRRQYFRIAPPALANIVFSRTGTPEEAQIINLSEGGALIALNGPLRGPRMLPGESMRNLRLQCKEENLHTDIRIGKAVVRREQMDSKTERASYALEFVEVDSREERKLQEFIFKCQREVLRKRIALEKGL